MSAAVVSAVVSAVVAGTLSLGSLGAVAQTDPTGPSKIDEALAQAKDGQGVRFPVADITFPVADLRFPVRDVATTKTQGAETTLTLAADLLFAFGSAEVTEQVRAKIPEWLTEVPQGAAVAVGGHTDNRGSAEFNQTLSEQRAEAVAAVIREARPDLQLTVKGFGLTKPVASNGTAQEDNPEGRAQNRRVELTYSS